MYAQYVGNLLPSQFALLTQIHGQAPHLVLSFSRELSGIDLFHAYLYREFDCRVNNALPRGEPVVLVSHQVNITALSRIYPVSGEGLILALPLTVPAKVLARIPPP